MNFINYYMSSWNFISRPSWTMNPWNAFHDEMLKMKCANIVLRKIHKISSHVHHIHHKGVGIFTRRKKGIKMLVILYSLLISEDLICIGFVAIKIPSLTRGKISTLLLQLFFEMTNNRCKKIRHGVRVWIIYDAPEELLISRSSSFIWLHRVRTSCYFDFIMILLWWFLIFFHNVFNQEESSIFLTW